MLFSRGVFIPLQRYLNRDDLLSISYVSKRAHLCVQKDVDWEGRLKANFLKEAQQFANRSAKEIYCYLSKPRRVPLFLLGIYRGHYKLDPVDFDPSALYRNIPSRNQDYPILLCDDNFALVARMNRGGMLKQLQPLRIGTKMVLLDPIQSGETIYREITGYGQKIHLLQTPTGEYRNCFNDQSLREKSVPILIKMIYAVRFGKSGLSSNEANAFTGKRLGSNPTRNECIEELIQAIGPEYLHCLSKEEPDQIQI